MGSTRTDELTYEQISRYFDKPVIQAAKELNIGIALLKKKCRELNIPRWPYRKLRSLDYMMKNVPELTQGGEDGEEKLKEALEMLREEREMIKKAPAMKLEEHTKKLRQACFKHTYNGPMAVSHEYKERGTNIYYLSPQN